MLGSRLMLEQLVCWLYRAEFLQVAIRKIQYLPIPVIAMIEGAVWGGACGLDFSCDILVGRPKTSFTMTPAKIGVPYNISGVLHFMNMLPVNAVREMFFTAIPLDAGTVCRQSRLPREHRVLLREAPAGLSGGTEPRRRARH